jgi:hypothetical protein
MMASYNIGYGKPPLSGRFRAGVSGNPRGRPRRKFSTISERIRTAVNAPITYKDRGKIRATTFGELRLTLLVDRALTGDLDAAELVVKILARPERYSDAGPAPILVENWLADHPGQTATQKSADFRAARDAAPPEWWLSSEN